MKHRVVVGAVAALAVGAVAVLCVPSRALASGTGKTSRDQGTITLQMKDGACSVVATDRIKAKHGVAVRWSVSNECDSEYAVKITNFHQGDQPVDPLGCPATDREKRVQSGHTAMLVCAVRNDAAAGVYAYDIALNGSVVKDPELEIEN